MFKLFLVTATLATVLGLAAAQWARRPVAASASDQAVARAILDDGIKAQGGDAALSKIVGEFGKMKGWAYVGEQKAPISGETFLQGFDRVRGESRIEQANLVQIVVINGNEGWVKSANGPTEMLEQERLDVYWEFNYESWAVTLIPLKDKEFRLSPLGEISVGGKAAVGILVSHDRHNPLELYFDKETHLLVQCERKVREPESGREIQERYVFSDYRVVQGTKQAFRIQSYWDGEKAFDVVGTEMKLSDKPFDEKLFTKP
jgi:hypothetical protein